MSYYVDITPAIINKTAIFNIIKDTLFAIPELNDKKLALGKKYGGDNNFSVPAPKLFRLALKFPKIFIFIRSSLILFFPKEQRPIFFFDPLYVLFYPKLKNAKALVLDLTPITHPEWHNKKVAYLYKAAFKELKKQNIECYSISKSTKDQLDQIYKLRSEKSKILYLYSNSKYQPLKSPAKSKNILFVGSFEPRKNLLGLIKAFQISQLAEKDYCLNIVGAKTQHFEENKSSLGNLKNIIIHGYLTDEELLNIYQNTRIFAYPTYWEGFGVPLLEAINLKIAAFASNQSACPEIGGPDMKYIDPSNINDISNKLIEFSLFSDEQYTTYTEKIYAHASQFSFQNYINNLKNILSS